MFQAYPLAHIRVKPLRTILAEGAPYRAICLQYRRGSHNPLPLSPLGVSLIQFLRSYKLLSAGCGLELRF